ncbi:helical backbone metal receptor [Fulvivirgaceae bacterium BMA10]|uniref:Helical backbone metal receptor n=1 Tax=Splendidivirga corallicola TaxID=3051826 RepID=A0ABT8KRF4_9BACT|nr:helical backbone metal receptor [Fulvivirgaceae bacterium BMA10]
MVRTVIDQMGFEITFAYPPGKIVSLVPSQTEFLFDLGLEKEIRGITKFCIHPKNQVQKIQKIGGTKKFNFEKIRNISPDIIIGNKEENYKEGIEELKKDFPVWMSDITTLSDAFHMMNSLGKITGKEEQSIRLVNGLGKDFDDFHLNVSATALYFIWRKPYMVVGGGTFIDDMLERCGFMNLASKQDRYYEISPDEIYKHSPEVILLSSEPFPFKQKHIDEFKEISPRSKIFLADGEMFSWYGTRLQYAIPYFQALGKNMKA